jgi:hypothetical protein
MMLGGSLNEVKAKKHSLRFRPSKRNGKSKGKSRSSAFGEG